MLNAPTLTNPGLLSPPRLLAGPVVGISTSSVGIPHTLSNPCTPPPLRHLSACRARGWDFDLIGVARVPLRQVLEDVSIGSGEGGGLLGSGEGGEGGGAGAPAAGAGGCDHRLR